MGFRERYDKALEFKSLDVEEPIDAYFHRRLAAVFTALVQPLPIGPNQITFLSFLAGTAGWVLLYFAFFTDSTPSPLDWYGSSFLLFCSVILDCADGQLARAKGGGSRVGRILDGFVDVLVLLPTWIVLGIGVSVEWGSIFVAICLVAGFSSWARTIVYDKIKNLYLAHTKPDADASLGAETPEAVHRDLQEAREAGKWLDTVLLVLYIGFLRVQERLTSGPSDTTARVTSQEEAEAYRERYRGTMRLASFMGLGTHMLFIYTSIGLAPLWWDALPAFQIFIATVFNVLMMVVLVKSRGMSEDVLET